MMTRLMKVTVYFDDVGVLVPCCGQDLTVAGLVGLAIARYKKAIGKPSEYLVVVHHLKSSSGAILDQDDRLFDVIDDREEVFASFEEEGEGVMRMSRGDGTSASSVGTMSPDINKQLIHLLNESRMLRQASEPALTRDKSKLNDYDDEDANYDDNMTQDDTILSIKKFDNPPRRKYGSIENPQKVISTLPPAGFTRNLSIRKSLFKGSQDGGRHGNEDSTRRDPVGSSTFTESDELDGSDKSRSKCKLVELVNDGESLGIHVVPDYDSVGKSTGLLVHNVDVLGKIGMDGRIREMDKIIEINGQSLSGVDFSSAQNILREAMNSEKLCLKILPYSIPSFVSATKLENSPSVKSKTIPITSTPAKDLDQTTPIKQRGAKPSFGKAGVSMPNGPFSTPGPRSLGFQPQRKIPSTCSKINLIQQQRNDGDVGSTPRRVPSRCETTPSKKVGFFRTSTKIMNIHLSKGCYGLGFSITTRDVPTGRNCPIFIKHILPQGAAISDGRLQPGDKLLKVNGLDVSKKGHDEVVAYLRGLKLGGKVELLIERSSDEGRNMTDGQRIVCEDRTVEYLVVSLEGDIGIGMSVRGKTKQEEDGTNSDLGLFVKTIHPDGAAARDGRLRVDDRITEANGESLSELSNAEAREVLKDAMQLDGPSPQTISFVIERFKDLGAAFSDYPILYQERMSRCNQMRSEVSQVSEDTVVTDGSSSGRPLSAKNKFASCKEKINENNEALNDKDEKEDLNLENSNLSPVQSDSAPTFSRMAPARQSMSEKRKADQRPVFLDQIKSTRYNAQDHNETQITLKKALSAESLVSQNNNTIVKTPQINTRTCGLMKEALKKYTSVENMNPEVAPHDPPGKEKVQTTKSKSKEDSSEHGKKKFLNILKGLNIFKSKQKKENKTNAKNPSPPSHKMIDSLLNEKMRHNHNNLHNHNSLHPYNHNSRNKLDRPLSNFIEQDIWNDRSDIFNRFAPNYHYSQQSSLQPYLPPPPMYGSKACYCDAFACQPSYQPRFYPQDFSHCRTSSRSYFQDPYSNVVPYYHQEVNYVPTYSHEVPRKMRQPQELFYDDDFDEDLNNTISTIHHF